MVDLTNTMVDCNKKRLESKSIAMTIDGNSELTARRSIIIKPNRPIQSRFQYRLTPRLIIIPWSNNTSANVQYSQLPENLGWLIKPNRPVQSRFQYRPMPRSIIIPWSNNTSTNVHYSQLSENLGWLNCFDH